jgi:hypothetical protein
MTDIPQLIARLTTLRDGLGLFHDADQEAITEAIAELAAKIPANMTDTAELIARLQARRAFGRHTYDTRWSMLTDPDPDCQEAAAALAAQAREIATAHKMMDQDKEDYDELKERFEAQAQEIERLNVIPEDHGFRQLEKTRIMLAQAQEIEQLKEWGKKFHEVGSANAQRAAAAEAEVKRIKQMSLGSIYKEATDRLDAAEARVRELMAKIDSAT